MDSSNEPKADGLPEDPVPPVPEPTTEPKEGDWKAEYQQANFEAKELFKREQAADIPKHVAAKYTDDGGGISLVLSADGGEATVHVRDNGMGIAPSMRARMFDLFVQDDRAIDRSHGGLGIGLALVRHLVDMHGGTISAESLGISKGSDFVVRLPILPAAIVPAPAQSPPRDRAAHGRVLLIDDDIDASESLAMLLPMYGFEVETARDLESGLRVAANFCERSRPSITSG